MKTIPRDLNLYDYINDNFVKPEKPFYKYLPLNKKYNISYADIHHICKLIMLGNEYEDELIIPDYQRDLVWDLNQKQNLILSILNGNPIGEFLFKKERDRKLGDVKIYWTVIDGQQRMNAIKSFFKGEFSLPDGTYFKDLTYWDAREFLTNYSISAITVKDINKEQELDLYFKKNFGGTSHTEEDLQKFMKVKNGQ